MKITVLTYVEKEQSTAYDAVVPQIVEGLRKQGHQTSILGVHADVKRLFSGLARRRPDLVFNVAEDFGDDSSGAVLIAAALQLSGVPFTGGGPGELYLQQDKALTKKLLAFSGLSYPDFALFSLDAGLETGGNLKMPLFVKPQRMESSIGIEGNGLVHSSKDLMERVRHIHEKVHDAALAEEYIEGREFYVSILGNDQAQALPAIEVDFSGLPPDAPKVLGRKAKWVKNSAEYRGTRSVLAELPDDLRAKLEQAALEAYRALRVCDYGRVDLRVKATGEVYVLEVNASCYLEEGGEFVQAAAAAGMDYPKLLDAIAELALARHGRKGNSKK
jgi:D-alanine-D-alanine ligase